MQIDRSKLSEFGRKFNGLEYGHGSFQNAVFDAFLKGSGGNRKKIAKAFPEWFNDHDITLDYPMYNELAHGMDIAYSLLFKQEPVKLSAIGKKELLEQWPESKDEAWFIKSINNDNTIDLLSNGHNVMENAPLTYLAKSYWPE